jgi:hypothetical protein
LAAGAGAGTAVVAVAADGADARGGVGSGLVSDEGDGDDVADGATATASAGAALDDAPSRVDARSTGLHPAIRTIATSAAMPPMNVGSSLAMRVPRSQGL